MTSHAAKRGLIALLLAVLSLGWASAALATDNVQEGDNTTETTQDGTGASGDAVSGQVTGVVSSGDASVDATNRSDHADADSGDVDGTNDASTFTGQFDGDAALLADELNNTSGNLQEGDNDLELDQVLDVTSGDAVAGQVTGLVTSGTADLVLANTSTHVDGDTGDSDGDNSDSSFTGLATGIVAIF